MTRSIGRARWRTLRLAGAGCSALLALSCDSTGPPRAEALVIVNQPPATAQSGVALGQPVTIAVIDQHGSAFPESGRLVTVSIADGAGVLGGTISQATDSAGRAEFPDLVISGTIGPRTLRFASEGIDAATSSPITLGAGPAASVEPQSATTLQATVATAVTTRPSVVVKDASGNAVAGVEVTFALQSGGGTLTGASQTSDASGIATLGEWTLPTITGQYLLTATAAGVPGAGVTFTATATADLPSTMQPGGGGQSALYGSRLTTPVQVRVVDKYGNPVPGVLVTWGVVTGAGTAEPLNLATADDGVVRSDYRLGAMPGQNVIRASITPLGLHVDIVATALGFTDDLGVSGHHTCGLDESGTAWCWGLNDYGQLGDRTTIRRASPTRVFGELRFRRITTAWGFTCALTTDNVPYCWGINTNGTLGDGTRTPRMEPTQVSGGHRFTEVSAGQDVTCALTGAGAVYCWGSNELGQLGIGAGNLETCTDPLNPGSRACSLVPIPIVGGHTFSAVTTGEFHACGLTAATSALYCWGLSFPFGSSNGTDPIPVRVAPVYTFEKVSAGGSITCGIDAPASAYCWGSGSKGAFGNGTVDGYQAMPGLVPGLAATAIDSDLGVCAVASDARAYCWGFNVYGAVGDGTTVDRLYPTAVTTSERFTRIAASGFHTCGRTDKGQVFCWGNGLYGALGAGDLGQRLTPALARP